MTNPGDVNLVPHTRMFERYREVETATALAAELDALGTDGLAAAIADDFASSVDLMTDGPPPFDQSNVPFRAVAYPPARRTDAQNQPICPPGTPLRIDKARDIATALHESERQELTVDGEPSLALKYVDFELSILRKTGAAVFENGQAAGRALLVDLLLKGPTGLPVVCEVKLRNDKNALAGLIQALAYVAHLATPQQYERLQAFAGDPTGNTPAGFASIDANGIPRFDVCVWLVDYQPSSGTVHKLHDAAHHVAEALLLDERVSRHVERIVCLATRTDPIDGSEPRGQMPERDGALTATRVWTVAGSGA